MHAEDVKLSETLASVFVCGVEEHHKALTGR